MVSKSLKQLMLYAIGGGWGDEQPGAGKICVAVIRGTDIPKLRIGDHSSVPFRYESESKVRSRLLQVEDIVIEVSGGSAASGQHTGRALLVTAEILQSLGGKVIPASFCRLLRLDAQQVHPGFVVRQIDLLHQTGEIAEFENQSTGIANFQFNRFVEETHPRIKGLDAQTTIAEYISSFDRLISLNRRINQTLEAMAQAIFKSWFVDFDPVKAKIAAIEQGQDPLRAAMRAISGKTDAELDQMPREHHDQLAATATLFPDAMEASELGEIPKGWSVSKIETLLSRLSAKTRYTKGQISEYGQIPVFEQGSSILLGYHNRDAYYQASSENPIFIFGDHTCVTRLSCQPFDISQNVIPLKGKNRATAWAYYAVKEKQKFQEYRRHWMELISKDVVVATVDICLDFSKKITNIHLQIEANERQKQSLRELRDTLLSKLLSGELSVADLEVPA